MRVSTTGPDGDDDDDEEEEVEVDEGSDARENRSPWSCCTSVFMLKR